MATLPKNASHSWATKDNFTKLSFDWTGPAGTGSVSVKLGDKAKSYTPPKADIDISKQSGSLTNNTDKTITYTLS